MPLYSPTYRCCGGWATPHNQIYIWIWTMKLTVPSQLILNYVNLDHCSFQSPNNRHAYLISSVIKIHLWQSDKVVISTQQEDLTHHQGTEVSTFQETGLIWSLLFVFESRYVRQPWCGWESWRENSAQPGMGRLRQTCPLASFSHDPSAAIEHEHHLGEFISNKRFQQDPASKGGKKKKNPHSDKTHVSPQSS